ncbi:hypothetical protein JCM8097_004561 [Rhodosporidiobolus ruineniae]
MDLARRASSVDPSASTADLPTSSPLPPSTSSSAATTADTADDESPSIDSPSASPAFSEPSPPSLADRFPDLQFSTALGRRSDFFSYDWDGGVEVAYDVLKVDSTKADHAAFDELWARYADEMDHLRATSGAELPSITLGAILVIVCSKLNSGNTFDLSQWVELARQLFASQISFFLAQTPVPLPFRLGKLSTDGCFYETNQFLLVGPLKLTWAKLSSSGKYGDGDIYFTGGEAEPDIKDAVSKGFPTQPSEPNGRLVTLDLPAELAHLDPTRLAQLLCDAVAREDQDKIEPPLPPSKPSPAERARAIMGRTRPKVNQGVDKPSSAAAQPRRPLEPSEVQRIKDEVKRDVTEELTQRILKQQHDFLVEAKEIASLERFMPDCLVKLANYEEMERENAKLRDENATLRTTFLPPPTASTPPLTAFPLDRTAFTLDRLATRLKEANSKLRDKADENLNLMLELGGIALSSPDEEEKEESPLPLVEQP